MASDYYGIYDQILNTVYSNEPVYMRKEAEFDLFKMYDDIWRPHIQDIFPRTTATLKDGTVASVNDEVPVDIGAYSQGMARRADRAERTRPRATGFDREIMQGIMYKEWGPVADPFEFEHEIKSGYLSKRNQILAVESVRNIERRVEYELVGYAAGKQSFHEAYGTQREKSFNRAKNFDAITDFTPDNTHNWEDPSSDPIEDINLMNLYMNEMASEDIKMGFIGPNTAYRLQKNTTIRELIKYHFDLLSTPISTTIQGVTMKKVIGQTYKDNVVNQNRIGYPGFGDVRPDSWDARKKIKMMVDNGYEWGLFVAGPVGNTYTVKTHSTHTNPDIPYVHSWQDPELEYMYSNLQFGFFPYVNDFARMIRVTRMAQALV